MDRQTGGFGQQLAEKFHLRLQIEVISYQVMFVNFRQVWLRLIADDVPRENSHREHGRKTHGTPAVVTTWSGNRQSREILIYPSESNE